MGEEERTLSIKERMELLKAGKTPPQRPQSPKSSPKVSPKGGIASKIAAMNSGGGVVPPPPPSSSPASTASPGVSPSLAARAAALSGVLGGENKNDALAARMAKMGAVGIPGMSPPMGGARVQPPQPKVLEVVKKGEEAVAGGALVHVNLSRPMQKKRRPKKASARPFKEAKEAA